MRVVDKKLIQINIDRSTGIDSKVQLQSVYDMTHESSLVLWEKISSTHLQLSYFLICSKIFSSGSLEFMMSRSFFFI